MQVKKRVQKILSLNSIIKRGINDRNNRKITGNNWILSFWKIWKRVQNFPVYFPSFFFWGGGVMIGINGKWQGKSTCELTLKASYYNYLTLLIFYLFHSPQKELHGFFFILGFEISFYKDLPTKDFSQFSDMICRLLDIIAPCFFESSWSLDEYPVIRRSLLCWGFHLLFFVLGLLSKNQPRSVWKL